MAPITVRDFNHRRVCSLQKLVWLTSWCLLGGYLVWTSLESGDSAANSDTDQYQASATAPTGSAIRQSMPIEQISTGDIVLAWDETSGRSAPKRVIDTYKRTTDYLRILEIHTTDGTIEKLQTTDEHPFWVVGSKWVEAAKLRIGQRLLQDDGGLATVVSSHREFHPEGVTVYNLNVEDFHTYYVSQTANSFLLVHNNCYDDAYEQFIRNQRHGHIELITPRPHSRGRDPVLGYPGRPPGDAWFSHAVYVDENDIIHDKSSSLMTGLNRNDWIQKVINHNISTKHVTNADDWWSHWQINPWDPSRGRPPGF